MQVPPATGHSKTLVVPLEVVSAVGVKRSLTLQVPGPVKPPPVPQVSKSKRERGVEPGAGGDLGPVARVDGDRHAWLDGGVDRHVAEADRDGVAEAALTPVPDTVYGMPMQVPPATGHSNTFVVPLDGGDRRRREPLVDGALPGPGEAAAGAAGVEVEARTAR